MSLTRNRREVAKDSDSAASYFRLLFAATVTVL
jgi:hypothetical protein